MKTKQLTFIILILSNILFAQKKDSAVIRSIYDYCLTESQCYKNLHYLCKHIGPRLSGSKNAEKAVQWAFETMKKYGADTVYLQPVKVPVWIRGKTYCYLIMNKNKIPLNVLSLGNSVSSKGIILSNIIEIKNFEDIEKINKESIKNKIIFFNVKFNPANISTSQSYAECVKYRTTGASFAAKYGAKACIVRSMTIAQNHSAHTGNMYYDTSISKIKIPALSISYKDADTLETLLQQKKSFQLELFTENSTKDSITSYNVIAEIKGHQKPYQYITIGGHLDSWDVGEGAHDDGAGIVQSIEAIHVFKNIYHPQNTIRIVCFMNEENGLQGGNIYARECFKNKEKHLAAIESDAGGFTPRFIYADTTNGLYNICSQWNQLFEPYYIQIKKGNGGADINPLKKYFKIPLCSYEPDNQRYFNIHHTKDDVFEKVNKRELELGTAAISSFVMMMDKYFQ